MDITNEVAQIIGQPESETLEYKAVLPPSRNIAQTISAFANSHGGYLVLGVSDDLEINGLSGDFHANEIIHKALDLLSFQPKVYYQYVTYNDKKLYAIKVEKSDLAVEVGEKKYIREGGQIRLLNPDEHTFNRGGDPRIKAISDQLEQYKQKATTSKIKLLDHYRSILKMMDDLSQLLYPSSTHEPTANREGKVLTRILFSSIADNFETYLSDLLTEIYLAIPETLKTQETVTIKEVLACSDRQEFVEYWIKQKLNKMQKGSVKGFIKDNRQIRDLGVFDEAMQDEIEQILQIRHLYSHRNGIVDEKFLQYCAGTFNLNEEHQLSIAEVCDKLCYLAETINEIDLAALAKYRLAQAAP